MSRQSVIFLMLMILVVATWFVFSSNGGFTGFTTIENKFPEMEYLGSVYDAASGATFALDYDVFVDGVSKGHFASALDACQTIFPSTQEVWETSSAGEKQVFTSKSGKKSERNSYANYCYG